MGKNSETNTNVGTGSPVVGEFEDHVRCTANDAVTERGNLVYGGEVLSGTLNRESILETDLQNGNVEMVNQLHVSRQYGDNQDTSWSTTAQNNEFEGNAVLYEYNKANPERSFSGIQSTYTLQSREPLQEGDNFNQSITCVYPDAHIDADNQTLVVKGGSFEANSARTLVRDGYGRYMVSDSSSEGVVNRNVQWAANPNYTLPSGATFSSPSVRPTNSPTPALPSDNSSGVNSSRAGFEIAAAISASIMLLAFLLAVVYRKCGGERLRYSLLGGKSSTDIELNEVATDLQASEQRKESLSVSEEDVPNQEAPSQGWQNRVIEGRRVANSAAQIRQQ